MAWMAWMAWMVQYQDARDEIHNEHTVVNRIVEKAQDGSTKPNSHNRSPNPGIRSKKIPVPTPGFSSPNTTLSYATQKISLQDWKSNSWNSLCTTQKRLSRTRRADRPKSKFPTLHQPACGDASISISIFPSKEPVAENFKGKREA